MRKSHQDIIIGVARKLAWRVSKKWNIDFDDAYGEAVTLGVEAYQVWDKDKAALTSWVWLYISRGMYHWGPKQHRDGGSCIDPSTIEEIGASYHQFNLREFLFGLSNDAQTLLSELYSSPGDFINRAGGVHYPKNIKSELLIHMVQTKGGTQSRWRRAIKEVREAYND